MNDISKEYEFPAISVVFMKTEDLFEAYWNKICLDQNISCENRFHHRPVFQDVIKLRQHGMYFRVVMQQPWRYSAKQNLTFILLC